ncbi:hypothetical protein AMTRI_Chr04g247660 [Amborella trichopoda]
MVHFKTPKNPIFPAPFPANSLSLYPPSLCNFPIPCASLSLLSINLVPLSLIAPFSHFPMFPTTPKILFALRLSHAAALLDKLDLSK